MSQVNTLLESAKGSWKNLQSDAAKLAGKWSRTGLLEGLGEVEKNNMSLMLENQAKQLEQKLTLSLPPQISIQVLKVKTGLESLYH